MSGSRRGVLVRACVALAVVGALSGCAGAARRAEAPERVVYLPASSQVPTSAAAARAELLARPVKVGVSVRLPGSDASGTLAITGSYRSEEPGSIAKEIFDAIGSGDTRLYLDVTGYQPRAGEMTTARVALFGFDTPSSRGRIWADSAEPSGTMRFVYEPEWSPEPRADFMNVETGRDAVLVTGAGTDVSVPRDRLVQLVSRLRELTPAPTGVAKPVIYLYPTRAERVRVHLRLDGELTSASPEVTSASDPSWVVDARPDGEIATLDGARWPYLFWEADLRFTPTFSEGACVAGSDTSRFLGKALGRLGLSGREAAEFEAYWVPRLAANRYNVISFQSQAYHDAAGLTVEPKPDTVIRVLMAYRASDVPVSIAPQRYEAPARRGFTVVEWGGCAAR